MARIGRGQLIFWAMVVLDDAIKRSVDGPLKPSFGVRLALMLLHALGDGDRHCLDGFWRNLQDPLLNANEQGRRYLRPTNGRSYLHAIARSVGVDYDVPYMLELDMARMPADERRKKREEQARLAAHRRRLIEDGWQYQEEDRRRAAAEAARSDLAPGAGD